MSPTGPLYAGTAVSGSGSNGVWTNPGNATGVNDGVYASGNISSGGSQTNPLNLSNFSFAIPSTGIIDGIYVEVDRYGNNATDRSLQLIKAGTSVGTTKANAFNWPVSESYYGYGGSTDLWGTTWTPSDINNAGFGVGVIAYNSSGGGSAFIDAVRITVYWHTAPFYNPKTYRYATFNNGQYVGDIPNVTSDFQNSYDINTAGTQITVKSASSPDTSILPNSALLDESGNTILDENSNVLTDDGTPPIVSLGTGNQLIRNGNQVIVYEYGYWHPNGKVVFRGVIERWEADYGGDSSTDQINILVYSDGSDLDNYVVRGYPYIYTADVLQSASNVFETVTIGAGSYNLYGQTWKVGAGVTNLAAINISLYGTAPVMVSVFTDSTRTVFLGSSSQSVNATVQGTYTFAFTTPIVVTPGNTYFFTVTTNIYYSIQIAAQNTAVYSNGTMWNANWAGGGGGNYATITGDLYFETFSGVGSTTSTFTSLDPTTGMAEPIMNDYNARGGLITYTSSSIVATGLSITTEFNTNTTYEALQQLLTMCPNGFYYTVDLGTDILSFKQVNTTPDITLTKGLHISNMTLIATIEQIVNSVLFTGGVVTVGPPAVNLYKQYSNASSIALYGIHLDRPTNNLVTSGVTADAIGKSEIATQSSEQYQTTVTVVDYSMDISSIKPGMSVGFNGFGTFVDNLVLQIVRVDYTPESATLTLGILPKRVHQAVEQVVRGVIGLNTVDNPTTPS